METSTDEGAVKEEPLAAEEHPPGDERNVAMDTTDLIKGEPEPEAETVPMATPHVNPTSSTTTTTTTTTPSEAPSSPATMETVTTVTKTEGGVSPTPVLIEPKTEPLDPSPEPQLEVKSQTEQTPEPMETPDTENTIPIQDVKTEVPETPPIETLTREQVSLETHPVSMATEESLHQDSNESTAASDATEILTTSTSPTDSITMTPSDATGSSSLMHHPTASSEEALPPLEGATCMESTPSVLPPEVTTTEQAPPPDQSSSILTAPVSVTLMSDAPPSCQDCPVEPSTPSTSNVTPASSAESIPGYSPLPGGVATAGTASVSMVTTPQKRGPGRPRKDGQSPIPRKQKQ